MSMPSRDPVRDEGSAGLIAMLQNVDRDVKQHSTQLSDLAHEMKDATKIIERLDRMIRGDNGDKSLMVRIELMEGSQNRTATALTETKADIGEVRRLLETTRTEDTKGKWSMASSIATGLLALITALLAGLLTILMNRHP